TNYAKWYVTFDIGGGGGNNRSEKGGEYGENNGYQGGDHSGCRGGGGRRGSTKEKIDMERPLLQQHSSEGFVIHIQYFYGSVSLLPLTAASALSLKWNI
ncbi:hypothetical protein C5167_029508, partial [Papaver somniferum]